MMALFSAWHAHEPAARADLAEGVQEHAVVGHQARSS